MTCRFSATRLWTLLILLVACLGVPRAAADDADTAVAVLERSYAAMGGMLPTSMTVEGTVSITEGASSESGSFLARARGFTQTREDITASSRTRACKYSRDHAAELMQDGEFSRVSREKAVTSRTDSMPLLWVAAVLQDPGMETAYVAREDLDGVQAHRIRAWNTFASDPGATYLSPLSVFDLWISEDTDLPVRLEFEQRSSRGATVPSARVTTFADYKTQGGITYPTLVERQRNRREWLKITLIDLRIDESVSDSDFDPGQ